MKNNLSSSLLLACLIGTASGCITIPIPSHDERKDLHAEVTQLVNDSAPFWKVTDELGQPIRIQGTSISYSACKEPAKLDTVFFGPFGPSGESIIPFGDKECSELILDFNSNDRLVGYREKPIQFEVNYQVYDGNRRTDEGLAIITWTSVNYSHTYNIGYIPLHVMTINGIYTPSPGWLLNVYNDPLITYKAEVLPGEYEIKYYAYRDNMSDDPDTGPRIGHIHLKTEAGHIYKLTKEKCRAFPRTASVIVTDVTQGKIICYEPRHGCDSITQTNCKAYDIHNSEELKHDKISGKVIHGGYLQRVEKSKLPDKLASAKSGDMKSQYELYFIAKTHHEKLIWLCKAADSGYPFAQAELGEIYRWGLMGIEQDHQKAYQWYWHAHKQEPRYWKDELEEVSNMIFENDSGMTSEKLIPSKLQPGQCARDLLQ